MRQLTAILFSDIVGFSKQMAANEKTTLANLKKNGRLHERIVKQFGGKVVKAMGDGYLCVFNSSIDAVLAGDLLQKEVEEAGLYQLRVGIHVGDVVHQKNRLNGQRDVYGDGVNIASRIESNAPRPGVWVSARVAGDLTNHEFVKLTSAGMFELKNIPQPVEIFEVTLDREQIPAVTGFQQTPEETEQKNKRPVLLGVSVALMLGGALLAWQGWADHTAPDTLAVLPFDYIGADNSHAYLADQLTVDLTRQLNEVAGIKVLSQATARKLSQTNELLSNEEVDYFIEGFITETGDGIQVQTRLVSADSDEAIWQDEFAGQTGELSDYLNQLKNGWPVVFAPE